MANAFSKTKQGKTPTDLHRSGSSPHSAGRRQGDVDERYSVATVQAVQGWHRARLSSVRGLNGSVLRVLRVERITLDFHE